MATKYRDTSGMSEVSRRIYDELILLRGLNPNKIANELGLAGNSAVEQWFYGIIKKSGERFWGTPKTGTIEKIEAIYGLRVQ